MREPPDRAPAARHREHRQRPRALNRRQRPAQTPDPRRQETRRSGARPASRGGLLRSSSAETSTAASHSKLHGCLTRTSHVKISFAESGVQTKPSKILSLKFSTDSQDRAWEGRPCGTSEPGAAGSEAQQRTAPRPAPTLPRGSPTSGGQTGGLASGVRGEGHHGLRGQGPAYLQGRGRDGASAGPPRPPGVELRQGAPAGGSALPRPVLAGLCGSSPAISLPPSLPALALALALALRQDGDNVGQAQGNGRKAAGEEAAGPGPGPGPLRLPASIAGRAFRTEPQFCPAAPRGSHMLS